MHSLPAEHDCLQGPVHLRDGDQSNRGESQRRHEVVHTYIGVLQKFSDHSGFIVKFPAWKALT